MNFDQLETNPGRAWLQGEANSDESVFVERTRTGFVPLMADKCEPFRIQLRDNCD